MLREGRAGESKRNHECGRRSCYGVKPNGDVVEQSRSKGGKLKRDASTLWVFISHKPFVVCFVTDWNSKHLTAVAQQRPRLISWRHLATVQTRIVLISFDCK